MNRKTFRLAFIVLAVCLTTAAVAPRAQACITCTTEGSIIKAPQGCCTVVVGQATHKFNEYRILRCTKGCYILSSQLVCSTDPCTPP